MALERRYRKILKRAGLPSGARDLFHKIRRTNATYTADSAGEEAAQKQLGHSHIGLTRKSYIDPRLLKRDQNADALPRPTWSGSPAAVAPLEVAAAVPHGLSIHQRPIQDRPAAPSMVHRAAQSARTWFQQSQVREGKNMAAKIVGFNYAVLDEESRKSTEEHAAAIRTLMKSTAEAIVEIGKRLQEVRDAIGANKFQAWIRAEFRIGQPVASNYMRAAAEFGDLDCLENFQQTALFDLARQNVPAKAVNQAVAEARSGRPITRKRAHEIIAANQSDGELSPIARDAARRLRTSLTMVAEHVDDLLALPQDDLDFLVDQLLSVATQLRSARRSAAERSTPATKTNRSRPLAAAHAG